MMNSTTTSPPTTALQSDSLNKKTRGEGLDEMILSTIAALDDPAKIESTNFLVASQRGRSTFDQASIRQEMVSYIENLIKEKATSFGKMSSATCVALARALERRLFKQAKSVEEYRDKESLGPCLRHLLTQLLRRRLQAKAKLIKSPLMTRQSNRQPSVVHTRHCNNNNSNTKGNATVELHRLMGDDLFTEAMNVTREIQALKLERASVGCSSTECSRLLLLHSQSSSSLPEQMPAPVRALFFETELVPTLARAASQQNNNNITPISSSNNTTTASVDWELLIHCAKANIQAYRSWCESS